MDRMSLIKELVVKAGAVILDWYEKENEIVDKGDKDFALSADFEAEKIILSTINEFFPNDSILSEEAGMVEKSSEYRWIVDPLDGTANFKAHIPYFCTTIAIEQGGTIIAAAVYNPLNKNLHHSEKNKGAFLNDRPIMVSSENNMSNFLVAYSTSKHKSAEVIDLGSSMYRNILHNCRAIRAQGSSILDLCNLAQGTFDGLIKVGANYWDYGPGCLIVEEAGGKVTGLDGEPWSVVTENIVATNSISHENFLEILR